MHSRIAIPKRDKPRVFLAFLKHPKILHKDQKVWINFRRSLIEMEALAAHKIYNGLSEKSCSHNNVFMDFSRRLSFRNAVAYAMARVVQARIIVETGVYEGVSSAFFLQALADEDNGVLYSIDLPNAHQTLPGVEFTEKLPEGEEIGFLIPKGLKDRWHLIVGDSMIELPGLLDKIGSVDIFFYDSLHSCEHMMYEHELAWMHLRPGGILASDDISWNSAFSDFCSNHGAPWFPLPLGQGFCFKPS